MVFGIVNVPSEIPVVFHNGSKQDFHFIIKELANESEGPFECIGENNEIYKSFSVSIKKEVIKTNNDGKKSIETISYKIKFMDSIGFISSSLTRHVDNLSEIYNEKCCDKNCKSECEFKGVKNNKLFYDCKKCRKEHLKPMN